MIIKQLVSLLLLMTCLNSFAKVTNYKKEINCLLEIIEKSNGIFHRNGDKHSSKRAREHLEYKYNSATRPSFPFYNKVEVTTEKFIDKIASMSSFSGKPYQIQLGSHIYPTKTWLEKKLNSSCRTRP